MSEGIGIRDMVYQTVSSIIGDIYVEDVVSADNTVHRQTFCGTSTEPISTARIVTKKSKYI